MSVGPVVRYMILCVGWGPDPSNPRRVNIDGLLSSIRSRSQPPYPAHVREMCVFLCLTGGRGTGGAEIVCTSEDNGQVVFVTPKHRVTFPADPLAVVAVPFRICDCRFPSADLYSVEFWYNGAKLEERPLLLR
jgi:hypothetical protein